MKKNHSLSRRQFLKTAAVTSAATFVLPRFSIGAEGGSPNSKLNLAYIGAGNIASMAFGETRNENIYALADVDSKLLLSRNKKYPGIEKAEKFEDFRVMLDKLGDKIDGVCVSTPDHTHFAATIDTMQRGIHVCTQKPLVRNIWQARTLLKAQQKYNVITNMGVQGHTFGGIRTMKEWYEADVFGQITEVHAWKEGPNWKGRYFAKPDSFPPPEHPVPGSLNYDLWLGPNAQTPFNNLYHPLKWRGFNAFGNGTFGDWFPHIADAAVYILDLYNPVSVELEEKKGGNEWLCPDGNRVRYEFAARGDKAPCTFYWYNGGESFLPPVPEEWKWASSSKKKGKKGDEASGAPGKPVIPDKGGTFFMGEKNLGFTDERSNNPRLGSKEKMIDFKEAGYPEEKYPRIKGGPFGEWVEAIKGGPTPGANFEFSVPFTETMLLGVLAARFGGKIEWDPVAMKAKGRPELDEFIKEPVRKGWEYGEDLG